MAPAMKAAGFLLAIVIILTLLTKSSFSLGTSNGLPFFSVGFTGAKAA